jgi:tetratricopeptide (TPR) repeat protein
MNRKEEALTADQESVELYRSLAKQRPDAFNPNLAAALNNLANMLSELGHREDALRAIEESVELYRSLAKQHPAFFNPKLALALDNLAVILSALGRPEEVPQMSCISSP